MLSSFGRQKKLVDDRNYKKLQNGFSGIPINSKFNFAEATENNFICRTINSKCFST